MRLLGCDIGGTKCAVSLGETGGDEIRLLDRVAFATPGDWHDALDELTRIARGMNGAPEAVGVSCGGPLDARSGEVLSPPNLPGWDNVPVTRLIREALGVPAYLENDANACALAEWRWGAGRGTRSMAFLTFGTGLGAGLILDGRLFRGANGNAGEVGHLRLTPFGPAGYGKEGSFEGFCSGGGIAQIADTLARRARQRGERAAYADGEITARTVAEAAANGDVTALEVFSLCGEKLGEGLALLVDIVNPERIVIGSIFARCEALLRPAMARAMARECLDAAYRIVEVVPAALGERIGDYAALSVAAYRGGAMRE